MWRIGFVKTSFYHGFLFCFFFRCGSRDALKRPVVVDQSRRKGGQRGSTDDEKMSLHMRYTFFRVFCVGERGQLVAVDFSLFAGGGSLLVNQPAEVTFLIPRCWSLLTGATTFVSPCVSAVYHLLVADRCAVLIGGLAI